MSEKVGINDMKKEITYLINGIPRKLKYIKTDTNNGYITLQFYDNTLIKHSIKYDDKYKVANPSDIENAASKNNSNREESDTNTVKFGIKKMDEGNEYLINGTPKFLEKKIKDKHKHIQLQFRGTPIIRHEEDAKDEYEIVTKPAIENSAQTNDSYTNESAALSESVNTANDFKKQNPTQEQNPTITNNVQHDMQELEKHVTSDQIQQSKNLETEINKYLNRLLNCINKNTADIKTKLIKQSFSDNQTWFGDSTDRYKFSSALRNMYTFFGNNANDYLLDQILTSITIAITNDENANILFRRLNKDKKTYTLYVQHSGWGIRSYYGIPLPKPQNPFSGTIELVIYGIYAPLHLIGRKVLQGTVTKLIKSREFYFKELKKVVATTCVNDCGINPKNSGGKRRQIKSKRRLRKTARRRTTRSYRKK